MNWTDTSLTNFIRVPITDNNGSTSTGSHYNGYLPSDKFTGATSFVDPKAKYNSSASSGTLIPSPYLGNVPNPEYYKEILSGDTNVNVLSDFNGLSNTETLVGLGANYEAANACWKYKDGASNLQWYLPAMGELGYIMPRFNEINNVIKALGGVVVFERGHFWCSSEKSDLYICDLYAPTGQYSYANYHKQSDLNARPFATIGEIKNPIKLITFEAIMKTYQCEEGMTWEEFVNSEYNIDNTFEIDENGVYCEGQSLYDWVVIQGKVTPSDIIIANNTYATHNGGEND